MKIKNINSVKVRLETLLSSQNETLTFVPETIIDDDNGEEYISRLFCLERECKGFNVPPYITLELLPNYLQSVFPLGRIIANPGKS